MGLKNWLHNKKMSDPVEGTFQLTGCSANSGGAAHENCRMHGVVTGPGVGPVAVEHYCTAPTKKWPHPGETLPVTVDRADPTRLSIDWDRVTATRDLAQQQAENLARAMGGTATNPVSTVKSPGGSTTTTNVTFGPGKAGTQLPPGVGDEVRSLIDKLVSDARASGASVTTSVNYEVLGDPGRAMPGAAGGGLTPDQAALAMADPAAAGLVRADATVIAAHEVAVPPGMPGGGPAGTVDLTLDVTLPAGGGFATSLRLAFSTPEKRARVATVGTRVPVLVDPNAHDRVAIDTSRM